MRRAWPIAADVPIVPHIVWGAQRIWTKGHPKNMWRPKVPISVAVGEPIMPTLPPTELTALLHSRMQHLLERVQDAYGPYPPGEYWVPHRLGGGAPTLAEANRMDAEEASRKGRARPRANGSRPHRGAGVAGMEPVFRTLEIAVNGGDQGHREHGSPTTVWRTSRTRGGAVIAINHTSYVDFLPAALAAYQRHRRHAVHDQDGDAGGEDRQLSDQALRDHSGGSPRRGQAPTRLRWSDCGPGRLVAVYPEATISRSFELKEFKTGAARMALDARVPIVPLIVWGAQRMWTKDHPRNAGPQEDSDHCRGREPSTCRRHDRADRAPRCARR